VHVGGRLARHPAGVLHRFVLAHALRRGVRRRRLWRTRRGGCSNAYASCVIASIRAIHGIAPDLCRCLMRVQICMNSNTSCCVLVHVQDTVQSAAAPRKLQSLRTLCLGCSRSRHAGTASSGCLATTAAAARYFLLPHERGGAALRRARRRQLRHIFDENIGIVSDCIHVFMI